MKALLENSSDKRGGWIVKKGDELYIGTIYTTIKDASNLTNSDIEKLRSEIKNTDWTLITY